MCSRHGARYPLSCLSCALSTSLQCGGHPSSAGTDSCSSPPRRMPPPTHALPHARTHQPPHPAVAARSDLGAHIDGFIATQATTLVVQSSFESPVEGRAADVIQAARTAFDAAARLIKPGKKVRRLQHAAPGAAARRVARGAGARLRRQRGAPAPSVRPHTLTCPCPRPLGPNPLPSAEQRRVRQARQGGGALWLPPGGGCHVPPDEAAHHRRHQVHPEPPLPRQQGAGAPDARAARPRLGGGGSGGQEGGALRGRMGQRCRANP